MKQVVYYNSTRGGYCMTTLQNYNSYIQDARKILFIENCKTEADAEEFVLNMCKFYNDDVENYIIIN